MFMHLGDFLFCLFHHGDALTSVCTFVKKHLHGGPPESIDTDALQQRVRELEEQNKKLENELTVVKQQVKFNMSNVYP